MTPAGSVSVSVIVNTYNWPGALKLSLQSLACQTDRCFEVIIADDGSRQDTADVIKLFTDSASIPVRHVWHEDIGFRRSAILNKAIGEACGPYLIFVDGDCILQPDFVAQHRALAKPNYVITGSRILLSQEFSKQLLAAGTWNYRAFRRNILRHRLKGDISKIVAFFVRLPWRTMSDYRSFVFRRIKGCNLACWKSDALSVGGFDETFTGWGYEDADFVFRLQDKGIIRRAGTWATEVLHIWHKPADPSRAATNQKVVLDRIEAARLRNKAA
ncbi:glycosyltransferase [Mesorhizobium sp. M1A.F.Ca.IN.020.06.1.1]|uniref:glycosyltransferase family 2 protein n=1 Tax=unclassified Mesorhizobium TaxID=325217 RepID=UPI000BAF35FD|nr:MULTISPECIES: glycosyltransferase family 2 protein [unclassified Mesorhizobium]PBB31327.1 glycosyl transferase [Mesorhizobium sp. WSM3882]RUV06466.1 glycosyltransferase [Mesorhizobium sp. M1A.F.Ca.IN.020.03.2.1]RUV87514.1 glycosyltransferase [Mesorhizobium sp. M1A.F.Ca.IN.020.32.1.1]RUW10940.1 glycosyltransferase [Mesorhizobium sp. M1A.F.Ca.IN.022.05.2.1]RUW29834.1 glycosyltransferase [Mesorhizobium sp. M1A.F.Ca.IN.020.06.1.1]